MITIATNTASEAWVKALELLKKEGLPQGGRSQSTTELLHVAFQINDPRQRLVFGREINPAFAIAEVIWILAGSNDAEILKRWNKRMGDFVDGEASHFHGAYGYRLGFRPTLKNIQVERLRHSVFISHHTTDQVSSALTALRKKRDSRQVVLQYWDSEIDLPNPNERSNDVPCNIFSHLMIRGNKLEWLQVMRSNDLIWGTPYNFIQFMTFQEIFAGWLGVEVGQYNHISDSLHIYQRHERYLTEVTPVFSEVKNNIDLRASYEEWESIWTTLVDVLLKLSDSNSQEEILETLSLKDHVGAGYAQWIHLLCAEALRRNSFEAAALDVIEGSGDYWKSSWLKWKNSIGK